MCHAQYPLSPTPTQIVYPMPSQIRTCDSNPAYPPELRCVGRSTNALATADIENALVWEPLGVDCVQQTIRPPRIGPCRECLSCGPPDDLFQGPHVHPFAAHHLHPGLSPAGPHFAWISDAGFVLACVQWSKQGVDIRFHGHQQKALCAKALGFQKPCG